MPLHDHFRPPLSVTRPWEGVHSAWATMIAQALNRVLPPEYVALPQVSRGPAVEIDVAALEMTGPAAGGAPESRWAPEAPAWSLAVDWAERDLFEVRVIDVRGGPRLAGAIELISPANKDRPAARQAFAGKCAGLLRQGVGLVIVDAVTTRHHDLHRELLGLLELDAPAGDRDPAAPPLYAVAYRTVAEQSSRLDVWPHDLHVGAALPTLPLWLAPDLAVPVNLDAAYAAACEMLRIG